MLAATKMGKKNPNLISNETFDEIKFSILNVYKYTHFMCEMHLNTSLCFLSLRLIFIQTDLKSFGDITAWLFLYSA